MKYKLFTQEDIHPDVRYKNWRDLRIGVFDFESTGVSPFSDDTRIVQVCLKVIHRYGGMTEPEEQSMMDIIINPEIPIPEGASRVHNIYDKDVADKPTLAEVADDVLEMLLSCDLLCAYNGVSYDMPLLFSELLRIDYNPVHMFCLDPLVWFRKEKRKFSKTKLIDAAINYNCQGVGAVAHGEEKLHDAFVDVEMLSRVLWNMNSDITWSLDETVETQHRYFLDQEQYLCNKYKDRDSVLSYL